MNNSYINLTLPRAVRRGLGLAATLVAMGLSTYAIADPPVTMAPPEPGISQGADPADAGADSVFQWNEVPANQDVPLTRAVFDQSGYQLYDTAGETIIVPFTNNNLYVMKFAVSSDGTTYFVNTGDAPVLYIPRGGSLENAATPGARWYPFSQDFHPAHPVYVGVAPSWSAFVSIGWSPDVVIRGGYWGRHDFVSGGVFLPSVGLIFEAGGRSFSGWNPYHAYVVAHPEHFHFIGHGPEDRGRVFRGAGSGYGHGGDRGPDHFGDRDYHPMPGDHQPMPGGHAMPGDHAMPGRRVFRGVRGDSHHDHDGR
jgi:hypothetical protein